MSGPRVSPGVTLRRGAERPVQDGGPGVVLRPGLAFGAYYDPERTSWGALVAHNSDELAPGAVYGAHEHRDTEILTWVLAGTLLHVGPDGTEDPVAAGALQYLSTGTGWHHDEGAAGDGPPVRAVQMWLAPALDDPPAGPPERHVAVPAAGDAVLAGPSGSGGLVTLRRSGVGVHLLRPGPGERRALGGASFRHVHVVGGTVTAGEDSAGEGDTLEIAGGGVVELLAGGEGAEVLVVATA